MSTVSTPWSFSFNGLVSAQWQDDGTLTFFGSTAAGMSRKDAYQFAEWLAIGPPPVRYRITREFDQKPSHVVQGAIVDCIPPWNTITLTDADIKEVR